MDMAKQQGVSLNYFIATALAEWIAKAEKRKSDKEAASQAGAVPVSSDAANRQ